MFETKRLEAMGADKIVALYREGRRDFSGVTCTNASFEGLDLRGAIFRKANLGFSTFRHANLQDADFNGANLEWTDFTRADLRGTSMEKVRAVWSRFNEAQFEKTNMRGADLSWSLFFNTQLYGGADLTNAMTATIALSPADITEEGMRKLNEQLGKFHGSLSYDLYFYLRMVANSTKETFSKAQNLEADVHVGYEGAGGDGIYRGAGGALGSYSAVGVKVVAYGPIDVYTKHKLGGYEK